MDLSERVMMSLWQVLGGEEVRPTKFNMENARRFYLEKRIEYPEAKNCVLKVTPHGNRYEIVQIMLNKDLEEIKVSGDTCVGRRLLAKSVADDVFNFLGGEKWKLMD